MRFDVFTLFPGFFESPLDSSILKRARAAGALEVAVHDIRTWTTDRHHVCDDAPYGGGAGMVLKAEPVALALEDVLKFTVGHQEPSCPVILMSPQGRTLTQEIAEKLSTEPRVALLCGHYEGIDERVIAAAVTDEISIGDYVLTGGEIAALTVIDAVARHVPGVLGNADSAAGDSFAAGLLEAPHYTRPAEWRGQGVPEVLLGGHHGEVAKWRRRESLRRTWQRRPDLIVAARQRTDWSAADEKMLDEIMREGAAG
jgi:tRNA (guanine37-N1)-methyltransferase